MMPERSSLDLTLRAARPGDVAGLVSLSRKTFSDKFAHLYAADDLNAYLDAAHTEDFYARIVTDPAFLVRVAEATDGTLGAYMVCSPLDLPARSPAPDSVELMRVYVDKPFQGRGLGTGFVLECIDWAAGQKALELYLSVFSENDGARRLYERLGFEKIDEFWFPVGDHRDLEFLMRKTLA